MKRILQVLLEFFLPTWTPSHPSTLQEHLNRHLKLPNACGTFCNLRHSWKVVLLCRTCEFEKYVCVVPFCKLWGFASTSIESMELLITYQPNPTETRQKKWWLPLRFCIVPLCSGPAGDGSSPALGPCGPCRMGLNPNMGFERWDIPRTKQRTSKQNITPTNLTNRTNHNEGTTWTQSGTSTHFPTNANGNSIWQDQRDLWYQGMQIVSKRTRTAETEEQQETSIHK